MVVPTLDVVPRSIGFGRVSPGRTWESVAEISGQVTWVAEALRDGRVVTAGTEVLRGYETYAVTIRLVGDDRDSLDDLLALRLRAPDGTLVPLLTETSTQAQILIPLVASLAFGLLTATIASLFLVPAFFAFLDDRYPSK